MGGNKKNVQFCDTVYTMDKDWQRKKLHLAHHFIKQISSWQSQYIWNVNKLEFTHRPSTPIMASNPYRLFVKMNKSAYRKVFGRNQMARKSFVFFSSYLPVHIANGRNERKESSQRYDKVFLSHHNFRISNYSNYSISIYNCSTYPAIIKYFLDSACCCVGHIQDSR